MHLRTCVGSIVPLALALTPLPGLAQSITPAVDGTGTVINLNGNQFTITGGTQAGGNLFHSFQQFGLSQGQIANFLSNPSIQNILGRVTGGDASVINGLLQVTGGNSNLYLVNPAGIIFGQTARLDVPGSFTATTANAIAIGGNWFNATGPVDYAGLSGTPNQFAFLSSAPGAIVNAGTLAVNPGQSISLIGGTVVNTGNLVAPHGQVLLAAVPGNSMVRLSQPGMLLSLELQPITSQLLNSLTPALPTPLSLPQLLTGGTLGNATGLAVNPDGTVVLTGSNRVIPTDAGSAIAAGTINIAGLANGQTGGNVAILGDKVGLFGSTINASGVAGGGTVLIGGNYQGLGTTPRASRTFVSGDSQIFADALQSGHGGNVIVWSDQATQMNGIATARGAWTNSSQLVSHGGLVEISGKQNLAFSGWVDVSAPFGQTGVVLFDPEDINIVAGTGANDTQLSNGSILLGQGGAVNFEIGADTLAGITGNIFLQANRDINLTTSLDLSGGTPGSTVSFLANRNFNGANQSILAPGRNLVISAANIAIGDVDTTGVATPSTPVSSTVFYDVIGRIMEISSPTFVSVSNGSFSGNVATVAPGSRLSLTGAYNFKPVNTNYCPGCIIQTYVAWIPPAPVGSQGIYDNGYYPSTGSFDWLTTAPTTPGIYNIGLAFTLDFKFYPNQVGGLGTTASGTPAASYQVIVGSPSLTAPPGGSINLTATGDIATGTLITGGGSVNLTAPQGIQVASIDTSSQTGAGGDINIFNATDTISTGTLITGGGSVSLTAPLGIQVASIDTSFQAGAGGDINVLTEGLFQATGAVNSPSYGGAASLFAAGSTAGGNISIQTAGLPFGVGSSAAGAGLGSLNGTANAIVTGTFDNLNVLENQIISGDYVQGGVPGQIRISGGLETSEPRPNVEAPTTQQKEVPVVAQDSKPVMPPGAAAEALNRIGDSTGTEPMVVYASFFPTSGLTERDPSLPAVDNTYTNEFQQFIEKRSPSSSSGSSSSLVSQSLKGLWGDVWRFTNGGFSLAQLPSPTPPRRVKPIPRGGDRLELTIVTATGKPIRVPVPGATRAQVLATNDAMRLAIIRQERGYLSHAQKLYKWLVEPIVPTLKAQKIDTLLFSLDSGLRSVPLAALYDGKQFLVENFSVGLTPSFNLTDTRYQSIKQSQLLAMGASQFAPETNLNNLPAVPAELKSIVGKLWPGSEYLNDQFTLQNLRTARQRTPYGIIHLATHAQFSEDDSFIQLWGQERLQMDQLRQLGWNDPPVELLVLSACQTAIGDEAAELGFAGLAVRAGVKSALGSLWPVSDEGTLAMMNEFYQQLARKEVTIKAEALRQAQIAMLKGQVKVENGKLIGVRGTPVIPEELAIQLIDHDLSDPYYWAGFTMVGSPW